jgi:hypothetical protein
MVTSISHPYCYGVWINKVEKFKCDTFKFGKSLTNLIRKGFKLAIMVDSLKYMFVVIIMNNVLVYLVALISN